MLENENFWKVVDRHGEIAIKWQRDNTTISKETRPKTKSGTGGVRYVVRGIGDTEYAAINLESAKDWADEAIANRK